MKYLIKNLIVFTLLVLTMVIVPFTVMANDLTSFEITSGINVEKDKESTFDSERTITGAASQATQVSIYVYNAQALEDEVSLGLEEEEAKGKIADYYEVSVGASRLFSQTIDLSLGENTIEIIVAKEGKETVTYIYVVNRKKREIKKELENIIVLPGGINTVTENQLLKR